MIFAQHGSRQAPHVFFDVLEEERYSETLDRHFVHRVLRIGYNYKGLTEIGGLVVRPEFRRHPERLGRLLIVRALPLHRPPPGGVSRRGAVRADAAARARRHQPAVGVAGAAVHRALSYQEADRLSQDNKEFIRTLFPAGSAVRVAAAARTCRS